MDLLDSLLSIDPSKRPTAQSSLSHPYFTLEHPLPCLPSEMPLIQGSWHEYEGKMLKKGLKPGTLEEHLAPSHQGPFSSIVSSAIKLECTTTTLSTVFLSSPAIEKEKQEKKKDVNRDEWGSRRSRSRSRVSRGSRSYSRGSRRRSWSTSSSLESRYSRKRSKSRSKRGRYSRYDVSSSREARKRSRSRDRKRSFSRDRKRSISRDRKRSSSRDRKRSTSRDRKHSKSYKHDSHDYQSRHSSYSRKESRPIEKESRGYNDEYPSRTSHKPFEDRLYKESRTKYQDEMNLDTRKRIYTSSSSYSHRRDSNKH